MISIKKPFKKIRNCVVNQAIGVDPQTFFLVSFPRSGNTWTRMLISCLLQPDCEVGFDEKEYLVPEFSLRQVGVIRRLKRPRIIKSHLVYQSAWKKVIYILRDPRDVLVSLYHYLLRGEQLSETTDFNVFVRSYLTWHAEETWEYHVRSWLLERKNDADNLLLLRYESMVANPRCHVEKIAAFLGLDCSSEQIDRAIERCSFNRLRTLEAQTSASMIDEKKRFYRKGCAGQWGNYFDSETLAWFNQHVSEILKQVESLGY